MSSTKGYEEKGKRQSHAKSNICCSLVLRILRYHPNRTEVFCDLDHFCQEF
ncbi:hypothetical protein [cyanobacterium endosymbiont of Rhopalodia gibberula]|uniref:hypothetical protein n=1 Tax=cyanobacterium endosymbiont of Rhopalodia gibberula TaxID=1763363 RepID=UPI001559B92B|nr:hypothetical protein [cyanobacterium endosymbiont of Rhopalodia gibberula]